MNKEEKIKLLMKSADFRHFPACDYDASTECHFSELECEKALHILNENQLDQALKSGGIIFVSHQYYYDYGNSAEKYNELDIYDGHGCFLATPLSDYDPEWHE